MGLFFFRSVMSQAANSLTFYFSTCPSWGCGEVRWGWGGHLSLPASGRSCGDEMHELIHVKALEIFWKTKLLCR